MIGIYEALREINQILILAGGLATLALCIQTGRSYLFTLFAFVAFHSFMTFYFDIDPVKVLIPALCTIFIGLLIVMLSVRKPKSVVILLSLKIAVLCSLSMLSNIIK